ncbi:MAG: hypothetical protein HY877_04150 [Deltaproteobacteria bacterium]|nr:hypothetical protein [Deltaproteobacteria bacterium]
MRVIKPILIVALWVALSFIWVGVGQSADRVCTTTENIESWLTPHPVLKEWYQFYLNRHTCLTDKGDFFKTLASSETLSTKMNQARITFDQFYIPLYHLMSVDWDDGVKEEKGQNIQSDLILLDHSLKKVLSNMSNDNRQYFQEMVLLDLPGEFV